jgi:hypothetical protein
MSPTNQRITVDCLAAGMGAGAAVTTFKSLCNTSTTLFITDSWFGPRERTLRSLLTDPITADQAEALRQAVLKTVRIDDVIRWLSECRQLSWHGFLNVLLNEAADRDVIEAERAAAERKRICEWADAEVERMRQEPRPTCSRCERTDSVVPLVYGLPGDETIELGRRGAVVLGGCMVGSDRWFCKDCRTRFE